MSRCALLLILALASHAAEIVCQEPVAIAKVGGSLSLVSEKNHSELLIMAHAIVAIVPADRDDGNSYTTIYLNRDGNTVKLQQRSNPADLIIERIRGLGFHYIATQSDRDNREPDVFLLNPANITMIERLRTESERSDTTVHFSSGATTPGSFVINQSAGAYATLRSSLAR